MKLVEGNFFKAESGRHATCTFYISFHLPNSSISRSRILISIQKYLEIVYINFVFVFVVI